MQYQVPQFIERESKIVGPLTLKQFGWFAGGAVLVIMLQFLLTGIPLIICVIVIATTVVAMAYGKVGGISVPAYVGIAFLYLLSNKKYLYEKKREDIVTDIMQK